MRGRGGAARTARTVLLWLAAFVLVVLLQLLVARPDLRALRDSQPAVPVAGAVPGYAPTTRLVRRGATARYSGARWRLVSVRDDVNPLDFEDKPAPVLLPPRTRLLVATFAVRLVDDRRRDGLERCTVRLYDAAGREWGAEGLTYRLPHGSAGCNPEPEHQTPGEYRFQVGYVVPERLADKLTPILWTEPGLPEGLRFER